MKFVTDRSEADVVLGRAKGIYSYTDLNRVEKNIQSLCALAEEAGIFSLDLVIKTDWASPGDFESDSWPTAKQMTRYLENVRTLCDSLELQVVLPDTMRYLTIEGANNIEYALEKAYDEIQRRILE